MTIDFDTAALIGFGCEAFLYGCYTILFALVIYLKLNDPDQSGVKRPLFIIAVCLYLLCTTHFALEFTHFYISLNTTGVEGFANLTGILIGAGLLLPVTRILGDLIVIYRCWVLWSKSYWVIILPSLSVISTFVTLVVDLRLVARVNPDSQRPPASLISWSIASFVVFFCTNVVVTTLIVARIWYLSPRERRVVLGANFPTETGRAAIAIIIESGALYLVVQVVLCIFFVKNHPAENIVLGISVQVYGIAPTLIFIRMFGLLNSPSGLLRSSGIASASRPGSTRVVLGRSAIISTGLGPLDATEVPKSEKPDDGDLGSNPNSMENTSSV